MTDLIIYYRKLNLEKIDVDPLIIEEMVISLLASDSKPGRPWSGLPVFKLVNGPRMSFSELEQTVDLIGVLYLAAR